MAKGVAVKRVMNPTSAAKGTVRRMVKDIVNAKVEHKLATVATSAATVSTAGIVDVISQNITQGTNISSRDGDMIQVEELDVIFNLANTAGTTIAAPAQVRVIVFADNLNTGSIPAVTDVLNSAVYYSCYNSVNRQKSRFKIYLDTVVDLVGGTSASSHTLNRHFSVNRRVYYSNNAGNSTDNGKGALFLLHIASSTNATANQYTWSWQLKYTDS